MNSQINAVIIAALAGLALAVLGQASGAISYIPPIDTLVPFNPRVLVYWVSVLGLFPLIFILIAIAVTARKAGLRSSIFTGLGAVVGVLLVIVGAVVAVGIVHAKRDFPFRDAGADRASFVKDATAFCIQKQRANRGKNQAALAESTEAVCSCYGNSLADMTTTAELAYIDKYHTFAPSLIAKTNIVSQKCMLLVHGQR
jgi:ABC-type transport system involved in multi-copper enzyme maturation permease subunit